MELLHSPKWNEPLGKTDIHKAKEEYGEFAQDFKELAGLLKKADGLFNNCIKSKTFNPDIAIKTNYPHAIENGRPYDLAQTRKTYKVTLNILYSACLLKSEIEQIVGIETAQSFYAELENCLRFIYKGESTSVGKVRRDSKSLWDFAGNYQINGKRRMDKIIGELNNWQDRQNLNSIKQNSNNIEHIVTALKEWSKLSKEDKALKVKTNSHIVENSGLPEIGLTYDILCRSRGMCGGKTTRAIACLGSAANDGTGYYIALLNELASDEVLRDIENWQNNGEGKFIPTEKQINILKYLDEQHNAVANADIEMSVNLSKNTVSNEVAILKRYGYVAPPAGKKRCIGITQKGIDYISKTKIKTTQ